MSLRTETKAKIKRASKTARDDASKLDKETLKDLTVIYKNALADIQRRISQYGDDDGIVRVQWLKHLRVEVDDVLSALQRLELETLQSQMNNAAELGVKPVADVIAAEQVVALVSQSVKAVRHFTAADGLQLSDRLWRVNNHARTVVKQAIESAVVQGHSASQAALEFINDGVKVPADVLKKMNVANVSKINRVLGKEFMTGDGSPYYNARRLFRTEINRAHGTAYQASVFEVDDVVGTRFLLSPNHPKVDICDMHSKANVYGLGPGVYPKGKSPWPAHPNTLSYEEVVFRDEVSDEDRHGKQSRIGWLKKQQTLRQVQVLGGVNKQKVFSGGFLNENEIVTPWVVLKKRYLRRGVDLKKLGIPI